MNEEPDILSSGPRERAGALLRGPGWRGPGRPVWIVLGVLLACLAAGTLLVVHRDDTISGLRAALRQADRPRPAVTAAAAPLAAGSALFTLPTEGGGSFSVVAVAVRTRSGAAASTWLFVYGRDVTPGQRYGLLEGTCGGQFVTSSDLADGTADRNGDLTIEAPGLDVSPGAAGVWVQVYRWDDGVSFGGVQGPLVGGGARTFRATAPC